MIWQCRIGIPWSDICAMLKGRKRLDHVIASNTSIQRSEIKVLPPNTLVAFLQNIGPLTGLIIVRSPIKESTIPAVLLEAAGGRWNAEPAHLPHKLLRPWPAIVVPDKPWIKVLLGMTATSARNGTIGGGYDKRSWSIACNWEFWETKNLSWSDRAKDLSDKCHFTMRDNSLQQACRRLGLNRTRSPDKKERHCQDGASLSTYSESE